MKHVLVTLFTLCSVVMWAHEKHPIALVNDTIPLKERYGDFLNNKNRNPFDLKDPSIIDKQVEYDPKTNQYIISEKIGDDYFRMPTYMSAQEYFKWKAKEQDRQMLDKLAGVGKGTKSKSAIVNPFAKIDLGQALVDRLFGGTEVSIIPQGTIDIPLGLTYRNQKNPVTPVAQQRQIIPNFDMNIQVNVTGKVGEKLSLTTSYNNKATFNFDTVLKLNYDVKGAASGLKDLGRETAEGAKGALPGVPDFNNEDEIIRDIDAGNVSLPLKSNLIQGASSLFGIKLGMQFGKLRFTTVAAQQQSRRQQVQVQQGGQKYTFQLNGDQYDENRHFFFTHSFRNNYEPALVNLPQVASLYQITYLEVWVTNDRQETNNVRDIVALTDLAEPTEIINTGQVKPNFGIDKDIEGNLLPYNESNNLYSKLIEDESMRNIDRAVRELTSRTGKFQMQQTRDFEKVRARKLSQSDYTFDPKLGYISLNFQLRPNQVLGVAFTYKYNGKEYKVGELAANAPQIGFDNLQSTGPNGQPIVDDTTSSQKVLFVKMLKSSTPRLDVPLWDLMMKNIYSLGASQINKEDFRLEVYYNKPGDGERRFLPAESKLYGVPLLQLFNLDKLNIQGDPNPDGVFDYVEGVTINSRQGKIIFPVLEPFGKSLEKKFKQIGDEKSARKYVFQQLYDTTITAAREFPEFNVFTLKGQYKGTSQNEIQLNTFNLPRGSVKVTAGAQQLTEGTDYEVNYSTGTIKILNEAYVNSSVPVNVSFEDNQLFGFQQKSMFGTRWDYTINKDFVVGGTIMKLFERPFTNKVNFGEDPINNNIFGLDVNYTKDAPWVTRMIDKLPLISTKAPSSFSFVAEGAVLKPGHARAINQQGSRDGKNESGGVVFLEDFEGSTNGTDLRQANLWFLSSVPQDDIQGNFPRFPESAEINSLESNKNRAKLNWYIISDNSGAVLQANDPRTQGDRENPRFSEIQESEIWPNRQFANLGQGTVNARLLDLNYIPTERGPYNFDLPREANAPKFKYSEGLDADGKLIKPSSRWAGIMRALPYNDFEASNVEFIDMWILSPFINDVSLKGKLHIDLGNVSEDILRDSRQFYENGLPTTNQKIQTDRTKLARIPRIVPVTNSFEVSNDRELQDVGLDGFNDTDERIQFKEGYLDKVNSPTSPLTPLAKTRINDDPANDNFKFFLDNSFTQNDGIEKRYFSFNNPQGNSAESTGNFTNSSTNIPDSEDLDNNKSLDNEGESYFHYEIPLEADGAGGMVNNQFVVDAIPLTERQSKWKLGFTPLIYRVRVPISQFTKRVGGIQDFRSIRFMRVYMTDFDREVTLRFAKFELSRSQWRRYKRSAAAGEPNVDPGANPISSLTTFDVNSVNFEENGSRPNFSYVLPPGIQREQIPGQATAVLQNEQAMAMSICNLLPEAERGIYKLTNFDLRLFKNLKMFVHMEPNVTCANVTPKDGELTAFIRLGNDFERNYYEYEIPIRSSNPDEVQKYGRESDGYRQEIWPADNEFNFPLSLLTDVKERRNAQLNADFSIPYELPNPNKPNEKVRVIGNPNIGWVKGIMIGVRNRSQQEQTHSVEVWVNELRAVGFNERGGGAGLMRADLKMADLGRVTLSGNFTGIGWGGLEQRLQQRSREQILNYDIATNIELGKFFPEKSGVKIPLTVQYSNKTKTPEYDPYDLDIKLKDKLAKASADVRDSLREQALTKNTIRNISFDNVRIESPKEKKVPMPWNISNFAVSYQNTIDNYSDPIIENEERKLNKGQLDYNYALPNASITPFKKAIKNDKYLKFITDFNFNPLPNNISFNTEVNRQYNTSRYRFTPDIDSLNTFYNKRFTWDRKYNVTWDITKGMKFNFIADVQSVIDEPRGGINTKEKRDSILRNVRSLGRTKLYNQQANLNYTLPTKQIPFMDWITIRAQLNTTYNWTAAALNTTELGNTIKNSQQRQLNGDFNFEQLYNKSSYLKKINTPKGAKGKKTPKKAGETKGEAANVLKNKRGLNNRLETAKDQEKKLDRNVTDAPKEEERNRENRKEEDESRPQDPSVKLERDDTAPANDDKKDATAGTDSKDTKKSSKEEIAARKAEREKLREEKKKQERENREPSMAERTLIRPLMMVRKGRFSYTETYQNILPGFKPQAELFGQEDFAAPGWNFLVGDVPSDKWLDDAAQKGWITNSVMLNESVTRNYQQQLQGNLTVEPITDFRIEFDVNKNYTLNNTHDFKVFEPNGSTFEHKVYRDVGSFTVSYMNFTGIFSENNKKTGKTLFEEFSDFRKVISYRLSQQSLAPGQVPTAHEKDNGYYAGFGRTQQEVLIPAFMAAFTGKDANTISLDARQTMPLPNWRLNYSGLNKVPFFKEKVQSFTLQHAYKSTLTLNQFNTNTPDYDPTQALVKKDPVTRSYYSALNIPTVVLNKEFSPLIGFDLKLKNDLSLKADFKKGQNLQMSFFDNQLMEQRKTEYTIGLGYKMKNVHFKFLDFLNFEQPKSKAKEGDERKKKKKSIIKLGNEEEEKPEIDPKTGKPVKKKKKKKGNDFNINCNVSVMDQVTYNRIMDTDQKVPTRGDLAIRISPSADYVINKRLTLRFEGEYQSNRPKTTLSFPTTTISGGIRLRFALQ